MRYILNSVPPGGKKSLLLSSRSLRLRSSSTTSWVLKNVGMLHNLPCAQRGLLMKKPHKIKVRQRLLTVRVASSSPFFCPPAEVPTKKYPKLQLNIAPSSAVNPILGMPRKLYSQVTSSGGDDALKKKVLIALIALISVAIIILGALLIYLLMNKKNKVGPRRRYEKESDRPLHNLNVISNGMKQLTCNTKLYS